MAASGPYIARLRTFEATGRDPYLVTDYVPSVSLKDALDKCGPLPSETVRLLASALCTALIRSHQRKVVHRDLKPANVLLALDGPRIIAFGIARLTAATHHGFAGQVAGTPGYMAPEQYASYQDAGPPSDVFSLGAVLAHTLTGRPPFGMATDWQEFRRRAMSRSADLNGMTDRWQRLIAGCLDPDAGSRLSAQRVRAELGDPDLGAAFKARWLPDAVHRLVAQEARQADRLLTNAAGRTGPAQMPPTLHLGQGSRPPASTVPPSRLGTAVIALGLTVAAAAGLAWWAIDPETADPRAGPSSSADTRRAPEEATSVPASATASPTTHDDEECHPDDRDSSLPYLCPVSWGKGGTIPVYEETRNGPQIAELVVASGQKEQRFVCQKRGEPFRYNGGENLWWAYTRADKPRVNGWVPQVYLAGGLANEPDAGLPLC